MNHTVISFFFAAISCATSVGVSHLGLIDPLLSFAILFSVLWAAFFAQTKMMAKEHRLEIAKKIEEISSLSSKISNLETENTNLSNENNKLINEKLFTKSDEFRAAGKAIAEELADGSLRKFKAETRRLLDLKAHKESVVSLKNELREKTDLANLAIERGKRALAQKDSEFGHKIYAAEKTQLLFNYLKAVLIEYGFKFQNKTPEETFELLKKEAARRANNDPKMKEWEEFKTQQKNKKKKRQEALRAKGIQARTDLRAAKTELDSRIEKILTVQNVNPADKITLKDQLLNRLFPLYVSADVIEIQEITDERITSELLRLRPAARNW